MSSRLFPVLLVFLVGWGNLRADVSLPPSATIHNQGHYGYCCTHAMAVFLELWANSERAPGDAVPPIDLRFLSLAYNALVGAGGNGAVPTWLAAAIAEYGLVPEGAYGVRENGDLFEINPKWRDLHQTILNQAEAEGVLRSKYRLRSRFSNDFSPLDYLRYLHVDLSRFKTLTNSETDSFEAKVRKEEEKTYRDGSYAATRTRLADKMKERGIHRDWDPFGFDALYLSIVTQLEQRKPVLAGINTSLVKGRGKPGALPKFRAYAVVSKADLLPVGEGRNSVHAVVAVGHCTQWKTQDPLCARFADLMRRQNVKDCIVLQNSWGAEANSGGYVGVSKKAARRMLRSAWVDRSIVDQCQMQVAAAATAPALAPSDED